MQSSEYDYAENEENCEIDRMSSEVMGKQSAIDQGQMSLIEKVEFVSSISKYELVKRLIVKNRKYEVHDRGGNVIFND